VKIKFPRFKLKISHFLLLSAIGLPASYGAFAQGQSTQNSSTLPTLGDTAREAMSPLMERKIGEQIMSSIRRDPDYIEDGPTSEFLTKMGNRLLENRPDARGEESYDFEFFAVRDPVLNAFAFPGGFIGFHSGLILTAQTESELAAVMGHEIGHVAQRHIARMLGSQKNDYLIPIAALILAALAARSSPDAAMGVLMGGQGIAIQKQINFTREAEREADRVGYQILRDGGYDTNGMLTFFGRMQYASRNYSDNGLSYLRSHPLTSERMADIQGRLFGERYKQRADGLDFFLVQSRIRVLQDSKAQGLIDAGVYFENQLKTGNEEARLSAAYGLAFVSFKKMDFAKAESQLNTLIAQIENMPNQKMWLRQTTAFASLAIDIELGKKRPDLAVLKAKAAIADFPLARGMVHQYAKVLTEAKLLDEAEAFLRDQISLYRNEAKLQHLLAETYAAGNKQALQHIALAEAYVLEGAVPSGLHQLEIARASKDVKYYDLSVIDAREREWKEKWKEELEEYKKKNKDEK
jgi:predicted Zn-dependent protease